MIYIAKQDIFYIDIENSYIERELFESLLEYPVFRKGDEFVILYSQDSFSICKKIGSHQEHALPMTMFEDKAIVEAVLNDEKECEICEGSGILPVWAGGIEEPCYGQIDCECS